MVVSLSHTLILYTPILLLTTTDYPNHKGYFTFKSVACLGRVHGNRWRVYKYLNAFFGPTFKPCISIIKVVINYSTCCMFTRTVVPCKLLVSLISGAECLSCFAADLGRTTPGVETLYAGRVQNYWQGYRKLYGTRRAVPSAANYPASRDYTRSVKTCKIKTISLYLASTQFACAGQEVLPVGHVIPRGHKQNRHNFRILQSL